MKMSIHRETEEYVHDLIRQTLFLHQSPPLFGKTILLTTIHEKTQHNSWFRREPVYCEHLRCSGSFRTSLPL